MHAIRFCSPGVEDKAAFVSTAGEHLQPLVERGPLWLEEHVPLLEKAEVALLAGAVNSLNVEQKFEQSIKVGDFVLVFDL